jgi:hypothetical protein
MRLRRTSFLWLALLAVLASSWSCRGLPNGPSLSNVQVSALTLQPTIGDNSLCCCRVVGSVRNLNSVPVHLTFKFEAFDGERPGRISSILYFVDDLEPQAERQIDAHGLLYPCQVIKELKTDVRIKGLANPPK